MAKRDDGASAEANLAVAISDLGLDETNLEHSVTLKVAKMIKEELDKNKAVSQESKDEPLVCSACAEHISAGSILSNCSNCGARVSLPTSSVYVAIYESAAAFLRSIQQRVESGEANWQDLSPSETSEVRTVYEILRQTADAGVAEAAFDLSVAHFEERGLDRDIELYLSYMLKSAEGGYPMAQYNLGSYHALGGVSHNNESALYWTKLAADQGLDLAQFQLGNISMEGLLGQPVDSHLAIKQWTLAAEQDLEEAQIALGEAYAEGSGVAQDNQLARHWLSKAANKNDPSVQLQLGHRFAYGNGVPQDNTEALHWISTACAQDIPEAQYTLAGVYLFGTLGVAPDRAKAEKLLSASASQGFSDASVALKRLKSSSTVPDPFVGTRVKLHGLKAKAEMNDQTGACQSLDEDTGRYSIRLDDGRGPFLIKVENISRMVN